MEYKMHHFNHATAFARPCIRFPICLQDYSSLSIREAGAKLEALMHFHRVQISRRIDS